MSPAPDRSATPFGHLSIAFDDRVLRPREWTTAQSTWAAELLRDAPEGRVLELCAGAGHIGLLTIALVPRTLVAVDLSPVACEFTRANAAAAGLGELVEVREGSIEDALLPGERFALVIADPPWVRRKETGRFPKDPLVAIDGGDDGLEIAWSCVRAASEHLLVDGAAILQLGTRAQAGTIARALDDDHSWGLTVAEVREYGERGVLVRLSRPSSAAD